MPCNTFSTEKYKQVQTIIKRVVGMLYGARTRCSTITIQSGLRSSGEIVVRVMSTD